MAGVLKGSLIGLTAVGAATAVGALVEAHAFVLRHHELAVLPAGASPMRVLHLSDFHLLAGQRDKLAFIASLAELEPDLVVSTGDLVSADEALEPMLRALGPLLGRPGALVFGSNDYYAPSFRNPLGYLLGHGRVAAPRPLAWTRTRDALVSHGWVDLNNRRGRLSVAGRVVDLRGTDDAHLDRDDYSRVAGALDPAADLTIGVTHAPYTRVLDAMVADRLPLILAGHTHGGQVCLPVNRALITNCDLPVRMASGVHRYPGESADPQESTCLHVSAGLGTSPFAPYRLFCRPEACLLTLRARPGDPSPSPVRQPDSVPGAAVR